MNDTIECGKEVEIIFDMTKADTCYLLECKLLLRWGLLYYHWMYLAFIDETPISLSLIHPQWLFGEQDYLEKSWDMSYPMSSSSKNLSTSIWVRQTLISPESEIL